jgi:type IV secretory pathway VirB10-like protein
MVTQPAQGDTATIAALAPPIQPRAEVPFRDPAEVLQEAEPTPKTLELQARVDELQARVLSVEDKILSQMPPAATETTRPTVKIKRPVRPVRKKATEPDILKGFAVNTIYRNQAWVEKGDVTYVVQTGDAIEGVRIVSVDAQLRQVLTDHGLIR